MHTFRASSVDTINHQLSTLTEEPAIYQPDDGQLLVVDVPSYASSSAALRLPRFNRSEQERSEDRTGQDRGVIRYTRDGVLIAVADGMGEAVFFFPEKEYVTSGGICADAAIAALLEQPNLPLDQIGPAYVEAVKRMVPRLDETGARMELGTTIAAAQHHFKERSAAASIIGDTRAVLAAESELFTGAPIPENLYYHELIAIGMSPDALESDLVGSNPRGEHLTKYLTRYLGPDGLYIVESDSDEDEDDLSKCFRSNQKTFLQFRDWTYLMTGDEVHLWTKYHFWMVCNEATYQHRIPPAQYVAQKYLHDLEQARNGGAIKVYFAGESTPRTISFGHDNGQKRFSDDDISLIVTITRNQAAFERANRISW